MTRRDGFEWTGDRFLVEITSYCLVERIPRYSVHELERMFLPTMTNEGKKTIRDNHGVVKAQLEHYAIQYEGRDFTGNGTPLLKRDWKLGSSAQYQPQS